MLLTRAAAAATSRRILLRTYATVASTPANSATPPATPHAMKMMSHVWL